MDALSKGLCNLGRHVINMKKYGIPVIVAINKFESDSKRELLMLKNYCENLQVPFSLSEVFEKGGNGGLELAKLVCEACEKPSDFKPIYNLDLPLKEKINIIASDIYGAAKVVYTANAEKSIENIETLFGHYMPICIAKTQYSFSDNSKLLGSPKDFNITVKDVKISNGAGFIVVFTGDIMTMPGLPKIPAANSIDINNDSIVSGLF